MREIDFQPVSARFGDTQWLNDFITPSNLDVISLYERVTAAIPEAKEKVLALWSFVANMPYKRNITVRLQVDGEVITQSDFWAYPSETIQIWVANCFNRSTLLASLLAVGDIPCWIVLGNVKGNGIGGHAWVECHVAGSEVWLETTQPQVRQPLISPETAAIYTPIMKFNKSQTLHLSDERLMEPLGYCCVRWLEDYLNHEYCTEYV